MELLKEFWGIITDAPKEIGENLTPFGKWTIWIPFSIGAIILITVLTILLGILHLINVVTCDFFPKLYTKLHPFIKRALYKPKIPFNHISNYPHYLSDIQHFAEITPINPKYWIDGNGNHPEPFTMITKEDIDKGLYSPYEIK